MYVDDIIFGGSPQAFVNGFVDQIWSECEMSMVSKLAFFLAFKVQQCNIGFFLSQEKYAINMIKNFGNPIAYHAKISKVAGEKEDTSVYKSIIQSLLYLTTDRPNIPFVVGVCNRYQSIL